MRWLLERLLGIDLGGIEGPVTPRIEWAGLSGRGDAAILWFAVAILVAAGVVFLHRRETRRVASPRKRLVLLALRVAALAVLAVIVAEPVLVLERVDHRPSRLLVLEDASDSMDLADPDLDDSRARDVADALAIEDAAQVRKLRRRELAEMALRGGLREALAAGGDREVSVHPFADRLFARASELDDAGPHARQATAVGTALAQALASGNGSPVAGILLMTDGQSNAGPDPVRVARTAAAARIPVSVLAFGTPRAARNARLAELVAGPVVFARDNVEIAAVIEAEGLESETARVVLEARSDGPEWQEVGREDVALGAGQQSRRVTFRWTRDEPGEVELRARIEPIKDEALATDNSAAAKVRVIRPEIRVLLVAGHAFPEVLFLTNTLIRDQGIVAACFLQGAQPDYPQKGDQHIRRLPETEDEIDAYDVVVLYDPDPAAWSPGFPALLQHLVGEKGGGLVFICGESFTRGIFDRDAPGAEILLELLPVVREPHLYVSPVEERLHARETWRLDITEAGMADGLFRFAEDPAEAERIGRGLPGLHWHLPVNREKPGAVVLARHGDPRMANAYGNHVIVASQLFGPGRSIFFACDSTYRWRYVSEQVFDGFWARVVDRAGRSKSLGGIQPLAVTTDRKSYEPGSPVVIHARFNRPGDQPGRLEALTGRIENPDGTTSPLELRLIAESRDVFEAVSKAEHPGVHFVSVWPSDAPQAKARPSTAHFKVESEDRERARPGQDRDALDRIAAAGGGRVFDLDQVKSVPSAFAMRRFAVVSQKRQELWSAPLLAVLLFGSLFLEWILRKRHGLP